MRRVMEAQADLRARTAGAGTRPALSTSIRMKTPYVSGDSHYTVAQVPPALCKRKP